VIDVRPRTDGYDPSHYVFVKGTGKLGDGQSLKLSVGESILCGRSRWCEWSLKKTPRYLKDEEGAREAARQSVAWRTTSRRHCRLAYLAPDMIEIRNLSTNGTFVDGHRVDRLVLTDCRFQPHRLRLGPEGVEIELTPGSLPLRGEGASIAEEAGTG
jgi:hypothetical protein